MPDAAYTRVSAALEAKGLGRRGGRWCCPAHEDRRPSLTLDRGRGSALLFCQAGCPTAEVMAALGLAMADLYDEQRPRRPVENVYPYLDEDGRLLFEVVRLAGKEFRQRRLSPQDPQADEQGYVWNVSGVRRVLYRLPAVIAGVRAGRTVYIAEGEKDVRALEQVGEVATCNPGGAGAGKFRPEYAEVLRGARVVVVRDRDEEGRAHAGRVAAALADVAREIVLVDPATGKDAADHLAAGLGPDEFEPVGPSQPPSGANGLKTRMPKLQRLDVLEMVKTHPPEVPWIARPLLVRGCLTMLAGREGEGKSLLSLGLAVAVAAGDPLAGFEPTAGKVVVVDAENGPGEIHRRVRALGLANGAVERLVVYSADDLDLARDLDDLSAMVAAERPALLVLDSFRTLWGGKENNSDEAGPVLDGLRNLGRRHDCATLLLHHTGKVGSEYRGSTAIGAACELIFTLGREPEDDDPDRRFLACRKSRPAPEPGRRWLRLAVEMGSMVCIEEARPFGEEAEAPKLARTQLAPSVAQVIDQAAGPLSLADICRGVGRGSKDGTVRRILDEFVKKRAIRRVEDGRYRAGATPPESLKGAGTLGTPRNPSFHAGSEGAKGGSENGVAGTPTFLVRDDPDDPNGRAA